MHTKKPLSILLTLALILGLLPWTVMPARAADVTEIEIADWSALKGNSGAATVTTTDSVTTITLNACIKLTAELEIASDASNEQPYVLDLNGYGIRYAGDADASVIEPGWKCSSLTLKDSRSSSTTYYITLAGWRGTAVSDSGSESAVTSAGNGVIKVTGGYITGGKALSGGGVCCSSFTMEGGTICGNKADSDGGVNANNFTMSGGAISYNSATSDAGGVNISTKGTAVMTGGTIAHNSGPVSDVNNSGTFVMTGGTIGYEGQSGKSICNTPYSAFYSKSGSSARCYGNFEVDYGKAAQTISTVTASAANGTVAVSSDPAWTDETTGYYAEGDTVTLTVTPDAGYQLDTLTVKDASSNNVEVGGTGNTRTFTMPGSNVTVSATFAALPVAQVNETPYTSVQDAINAASSDYENSPGTVTLLADVTVDEPLTIASGKYVTLDLNDHWVLFTGTGTSPVITLDGGALTLDDRAPKKTARFVTLNENGRATAVAESGKAGDGCLAVTGGLIAGGTGLYSGYGSSGGGVYVDADGTFTMNGGTICGNAVTSSGGGVYVANDCAFTMTGGTITGNTARSDDASQGGGVYVVYSAFTMEGGTISGNAAAEGGGVYVSHIEGRGTFNVSGAPVIGDNPVVLHNDAYNADNAIIPITVIGALTDAAGKAAEIWVSAGSGAVVARGGRLSESDADYVLTDADAACFHGSSGNVSLVGALDNGSVKLVSASVSGEVTGAGKLTYAVIAPAGAKLIAARYDGGRMTAVTVVNVTDAAGTLTLGGTGDEYRLFLVDGATSAPLCAAWDSAGSPG